MTHPGHIWDKFADSYSKRPVSDQKSYETKLRTTKDYLKPDMEVLEFGCGTGTTAIFHAPYVKHIHAVDISGKMLEIVDKKANEQGLSNITTHKLSWQDDWLQHGIQPHDVAIASRSLAVDDLKKAITRLNSFATNKICITDRVKHGPMDPAAFAAVGRPLHSGPDYIYTLNLLYQMGYLASVSFIRLEESVEYSSLTEAYSSYTWMFNDLDHNEEKRLKKYVQSITTIADDGRATVHRENVPTWAYISWQP